MKIKDLLPGQRGRVTGYTTADKAYRQKLLQMGLVRGTSFRLLRSAPLGDPVELAMEDFKLSLRKHEADGIEIEREDDPATTDSTGPRTDGTEAS